MGSLCDPHMFPIRSPYVRHMGKISKTTKSYVAHMLSNIWGNLWATQQHMGNIWGNVVLFAFKLALLNICGTCIWETYGEHMGNIWGTYGKHMGNIWETYGEHMGNIWGTYGKHMGNIWGTYRKHMGSTPKATPNKTFPFPCWCSTLKDSQASTKFVLKVCLLSTKWQNEFWIDGQSWWNPDLTASFSLCLQHPPDAVNER